MPQSVSDRPDVDEEIAYFMQLADERRQEIARLKQIILVLHEQLKIVRERG